MGTMSQWVKLFLGVHTSMYMALTQTPSLIDSYRHVYSKFIVRLLDPLIASDSPIIGAGVPVERDGGLGEVDHHIRPCVSLRWVVRLWNVQHPTHSLRLQIYGDPVLKNLALSFTSSIYRCIQVHCYCPLSTIALYLIWFKWHEATCTCPIKLIFSFMADGELI